MNGDRYEVPENYDCINAHHILLRTWQLEEELRCLNKLKKVNMAKFVADTRQELFKIWDSCFYGQEQRREFAPVLSDDYTDDLLSAHESELDRMRGFYKDNEDVYKLVQKRENLWKTFLELEVSHWHNLFYQEYHYPGFSLACS